MTMFDVRYVRSVRLLGTRRTLNGGRIEVYS